ncbi:carbohydrate ABC transporter permease [Paenibacillus psychroresistens]|uniref:Carbohydrate ABC transporter permease n=1 Tax=Paenibacillus psychroresistens TaxID=1778678 RepID=A0A6B8RPP0_9BACL|nr:carbohydrate ABC transporter permease [Paenibacillus psychroresistens]QGQ97662.1 carbohydrate ABC transporter permease [Paenibacillus psychroresistens]
MSQKQLKTHKTGPLQISLNMVMLALSILMLFPIVYELVSSFKDKSEVNRPLALPKTFYLDNYIQAFVDGQFLLLFKNSLFIAGSTLLITIIVSAFASYPLARNSGKRYKFVYFFFLSGIMVPFQAGMIPLYKLMNWVHLTNNSLSLILICAGTSIPISILIYTGFIKTVPIQLEEAALIDGSSVIHTLFTIVFPLLKPATVSVIILNMIPIWNDFQTPLIFISSAAKKTLPLGMYNFIGERTSDMGPIFAFSVLACILPILLFLILQRHFYKGLTDGAIKG